MTQKLDIRSLLFAAMTFAASSAGACPVCFGDPSAPASKGMNSAIWFLLGMVGFVQAGFVALFVTFWRRSRSLRRHRESFRVLEGGLR
jgi:Na+/H+ antiporter NhaD/arsenite permease-like protein